MPRQRSPKSLFFQLVESSRQPLYVIDSDNAILWANLALADWLAIPHDEISGRICQVTGTAPPDEFDAAVRGLGIAEENLGHQDFVQNVFRATSTQPYETRRGDFRRLETSEGDGGWLVTIGMSDATNAAQEIDSTVAARLAALVQQFQATQFPVALLGESLIARRLNHQAEAAINSQKDVTIWGPAGSEPEQLARYLFAKMRKSDNDVLTPIRAPQADPVSIQETIRRLARTSIAKLQKDGQADFEWILLLDADQLEPAAAMELNGFLELPTNRIRILATAQQPIDQWSGGTQFPTGLLARLSATTIILPPLAQRTEDLSLIFQAIVEQTAREHNEPVPTVSTTAVESLLEYNWPGNISELRTAAAATMKIPLGPSGRRTVSPEHLPDRVRLANKHSRLGRDSTEAIDLEARLAAIEKEFIERALVQAKFNRAQAAKLLGISRAKLLRRCEQLAIEVPQKEITFETLEEIDFSESDS
jgi:transcriptional regulator with PAS, ATPase and Fis domain